MVSFHFTLWVIVLFLHQSIGDEEWLKWPNNPPNNIPFEQSSEIIGWEYLNGSYDNYEGCDTWYPYWSEDDNLYSSFTDGQVYLENGTVITSSSNHRNVFYGNTTTGFITIIGNNTSNLTMTNVGIFASNTYPYTGRYPSNTFYFNNTWFYSTHGIYSVYPYVNYSGIAHIQCPFIGYRWSTDYGNTWIEPRLNIKNEYDNLFGETCGNYSNIKPIKFGSPHIVDFGKNMKYSPDKKLYIIAHGSNIPNSLVSWIQGDQIYMARVKPSIETINDLNSWEFYAGNNQWLKGNVSFAQPLFTWINKTGDVTMTYFNVLKKYIMTITTPTFPPDTTNAFDSYFLESSSLTGPWKYISYLSQFGPQGYFLNYPTKLLSNHIVNNTYYVGYLSYSANWDYPTNKTDPIGAGYHWTLQKIRFTLVINK